MYWINIYQQIKKFQNEKNKIEEKIIKEFLGLLKNSFEYFWGQETEENSFYLKENFVDRFETKKENDQKRKITSDEINSFFFFDKNNKKKIILCGLDLDKEEPKLSWFFRKNKKYEIENPKKLLEINKGKEWLSNLLKKEETIFLFGSTWKNEIPKGFRFPFKLVGLESGGRNSVPFGIVESLEKYVKKEKEIKTKLISDNSIENRKKDEIIIQFTTHETEEEIEAILPGELFVEKEGSYWNLFFEKVKTKRLKGVDVDRMLKNFFRDWEVYEKENESDFLSEKDKKRGYQFEPIKLYKTEYLMKLKSDLFLEKIKNELNFERPFTFSYTKIIEEQNNWEKKEKIKIKEFESKKIYKKNKREEEKKVDKLTLYSQTEYEFYKRHLLPEEKKNYK